MNNKRCVHCGKTKPEAAFDVRADRGQRQSWCRACTNSRSRHRNHKAVETSGKRRATYAEIMTARIGWIPAGCVTGGNGTTLVYCPLYAVCARPVLWEATPGLLCEIEDAALGLPLMPSNRSTARVMHPFEEAFYEIFEIGGMKE
jgi:hypothetical protein